MQTLDYSITKDWKGNLYRGVSWKWNYIEGWDKISTPNYVHNKLVEYAYTLFKRLQHWSYLLNPIKYRRNSDEIVHETESLLLDADVKKIRTTSTR
jgi:hypothetical protein